jgi:hypothetical protein
MSIQVRCLELQSLLGRVECRQERACRGYIRSPSTTLSKSAISLGNEITHDYIMYWNTKKKTLQSLS